jgi:mono/diheme cytochrome c family protein|tara:strand:- start:5820 stop:6440 length:621 start_codon:yes stop_codon:yes gene_type:complete
MAMVKVTNKWLLLLSVATISCTPMDDALAGIFGRHMRDSRSFDPYENTIDPPENTVPFASGNMTPGVGQLNTGQPEMGIMAPPFGPMDLPADGSSPLGIVNPVAPDSASLIRGEVMFDRVCAVCHGAEGIGSQASIIEKYPLLVAYNLSGTRVAGFSDGYIYGILRVGRGLMPSYGHQVSHFDRWHIVNYIRSLQRKAGNFPVEGG